MFKKISVLLLFTCLLLSAGGCGTGSRPQKIPRAV